MLDILVADGKRATAMVTADIDVQVGGLDVARLEHHDPKTQSTGLRSRRQGRVGSPKASFLRSDLGHWRSLPSPRRPDQWCIIWPLLKSSNFGCLLTRFKARDGA